MPISKTGIRGPETWSNFSRAHPPTPIPNIGAIGSGKEPSLTHLAHALSISLIKTIDLFILGGWEGKKNQHAICVI